MLSHNFCILVHKRGQCPTVKPGAVATCANECSADGDCQGELICCSNGCGTTCVVPDGEKNLFKSGKTHDKSVKTHLRNLLGLSVHMGPEGK